MNGARTRRARWPVFLAVGVVAVGFLAMHSFGWGVGALHEGPAPAAMHDGGRAEVAAPSGDLHEASNSSLGTHAALGLCLAVLVAAVALAGRLWRGGWRFEALFTDVSSRWTTTRRLFRPPILHLRVVVLRC